MRNKINLKTLFLSVATSVSGSAGLCCLLEWFAIFVWDEISSHPIRYPASILGSTLCLCVCIFLLFLYIRECEKASSHFHIICDGIIAAIFFPLSFCMWMEIVNWLSGMIR